MDRYHPWINNQAKELEFSEYYKLGTVIFDIWNLLKRPHARDASIADKMVNTGRIQETIKETTKIREITGCLSILSSYQLTNF